MNVRLVCTSKRRVPKNGILSESTCPISMTSPVLMRRTALRTDSGFMWFAEPRSSPAPHFDGQRSACVRTVQDWACAVAQVEAYEYAQAMNRARHRDAFRGGSIWQTIGALVERDVSAPQSSSG